MCEFGIHRFRAQHNVNSLPGKKIFEKQNKFNDDGLESIQHLQSETNKFDPRDMACGPGDSIRYDGHAHHFECESNVCLRTIVNTNFQMK